MVAVHQGAVVFWEVDMRGEENGPGGDERSRGSMSCVLFVDVFRDFRRRHILLAT